VPVLPGAEPYRHDGNEVGVLVCHGYTGSPQSMRPWAEHLAEQGYTVRLPRLPGHGTRWQDLNRTRWQDWYAAVDREWAELAQTCSSVFAVGLSMGGLLATRIAQQHQDDANPCRGIVIVNPIFAHDDPKLRILPYLRHLVPALPGVGGDIAKPGVTELAYSKNPLQAMHSQTQLWRIVVDDLPQLRVPVLLMRSAIDNVIPRISGDTFLAEVGSADVTEVVLPESRHVATLDYDAPMIFEQSVQFIERLR